MQGDRADDADVRRLQTLAKALSGATAEVAAAAAQDSNASNLTDVEIAAQLDQIDADMDAFEASLRAADPETRRLLKAAITAEATPAVTPRPPPPPARAAARSPLGFAARPPLAPPGSLDSTTTQHHYPSPADNTRAWVATSAPPPPAACSSLAALQRSAFASPRQGATSPHLPASTTGTPRGECCSSAGQSSPHAPPAPPPSLAWEASPRRDSLLGPALTPANSLAGPAKSVGGCGEPDHAFSMRSSTDPVRPCGLRLHSFYWSYISSLYGCDGNTPLEYIQSF